MLHSSDAEDWLKRGLCEAILVLCKSSLKFQSQFSINGLLAITVDQREVFLINVKETVGHSSEPLSFNENSEDGLGCDLQCEAFPPADSHKASRKRKSPGKSSRRNPARHDDNSENAFPKSERVSAHGESDMGDAQAHRGEEPDGDEKALGIKALDDKADDPDEVSCGLFPGQDFPDSQSLDRSETGSGNRVGMEDETSGFDLALVKVEKEEEDAYIPSEGHFQQQQQQTFQPQQLQFYGAWQADRVVRSGLHPNSGRPRSRRVPCDNQLQGGDVTMQEQLHCQQAPQHHHHHHHHHPTQRRVAREGRCENCGTRKTTAWRRSDLKELLCNACGCYYKLHKYHRPLHMAQNEIKTRCRRSKQQDHPQQHQADLGTSVDRQRHFGPLESDFDQSYFPGPIPS